MVKKSNLTETEKSEEPKSSGALEIVLSNQVILNKEQVTPELVNFIRDNLNFFNTEYLIKKKIGISTYQTEKYFKLIDEKSSDVLIPRGFLNQLVSFCKELK